MSDIKLTQAYHLFDEANAQDPNTELVDGVTTPKELIYGQRMTATLATFEPNASEAVLLAARAQHICRWKIPRNEYPMDRKGYLQWRTELKKFHADTAVEILKGIGYEDSILDRVSFLLQKKQLKRDEDTQLLEDVICLVFLDYYYEPFAAKHTDEKVIDILQKTWRKMSEKGHQAALQLQYSEKALTLIQKALA